MAGKKYKIKKVNGVKVAVRLEKDHERSMIPPATRVHKSGKEYDRRRILKETRKAYEDITGR